MRIHVRTENGRIVEAVGVEQIESRWELHKQAAKDRSVFTAEDLLGEYNRIDDLFGEMIAFVKATSGNGK
ncbi:hypothetical protein CP49_32975 [Bradyrhizobium valentinum]|uniref:Uncharacterized protein n=2 Tax=Bradyrhizobium valentinum TaxID=1518501 RepID=A0A0R3KB32_9BRAD|nr:hypothetical protein CP49_32975 [Bradyrhizobium valentinum]